MSTQTRARKLTVTAMLSTIAFILMYIEFPIPALIPSFVKLDISDLPELLAAFSLGPVYGVVVSLLKNVLFFAAARHFVGLCGRDVQFHHGSGLLVFCRIHL